MIRTNADWWLERVGKDLSPEKFKGFKKAITEGAYVEFANSDIGEIILHDLFDFCNFDKVNYSNDFNPTTLAYLEGQRSVLLYMLSMAETSQLFLLKKKGKEKLTDE